jgi:hypothetical protein
MSSRVSVSTPLFGFCLGGPELGRDPRPDDVFAFGFSGAFNALWADSQPLPVLLLPVIAHRARSSLEDSQFPANLC